jgi:hypothetical protein
VSLDLLVRQLQGVAKVALPFAANWGNYGTGTGEEATYSRFGRLVVLQGLVTKSGTPAALDVIGTLPVGFRPVGNVLFPVVTGGTTSFGAVRVNSSGQIEWITGDTAETDFTSLSGIAFMVDAD